MSDLALIPVSATAKNQHVAELMGAGDLTAEHQLDVIASGDWHVAVSRRHKAPLKRPWTFSDNRWTLAFAGDIVDHETVPFQRMVTALETADWSYFAGLNGIFAVVAHDSVTKKVYAVSDRLSHKPLFYSKDLQQFLVATSLAVFVRWQERPRFDKKWLWQSLYFNYQTDDTTFLTDVKRMPAASVLVFDSVSRDMTIKGYAAQFRPREPLLRGQEALRHAAEVFASRVPAYYHGASEVACALTSGWDGRTMLALAPEGKDVTAYTYGSPGCNDLVGAAAAARAFDVKHIPIEFDSSFVENLPHQAFETVYLSAGLQGMLRSTLPHVYKALTDSGRRFAVTIGGMVLDGLFRGHAMTPHIVAPGLAELFETGEMKRPGASWLTITGQDYDEFSSYVESRLTSLQERFGPFDRPAHHLSYILYAMDTFAGELVIADRFTTVRVPSWDNEIVQLAHSIEQSTLSYSQFLPGYARGSRAEMVLQSYLFRELAPRYYRLPAGGTRPAAVLAGGVPYQLERVYRGIRRRLKNRLTRSKPPLENWGAWLFDEQRDFIDKLLKSSETLVSNYLEPSFIDRSIDTRDMYMLGKLLTAEIVLRLIETKWQRFW